VGCLDKRCKQHPCLLGTAVIESPRGAVSNKPFLELAVTVRAKRCCVLPPIRPWRKHPWNW
jgi:hypothetical protein